MAARRKMAEGERTRRDGVRIESSSGATAVVVFVLLTGRSFLSWVWECRSAIYLKKKAMWEWHETC